MLVWRGAGVVVPGLTFVIVFLTSLAASLIFKDDNYAATHGWVLLVGFWISAFVVRYAGRTLDKKEGRIVIDERTGKESLSRPHHDFFFIRLEYRAWVLLGAGIVICFVKI